MKKAGTKKQSKKPHVDDKGIDYSDIPEVTAEQMKGGVYFPNGVPDDFEKFFNAIRSRPKTPINIRIDDDLLAWLKKAGAGYQTRINLILRAAYEQTQPTKKKPRRKAAA